MEWTKYIPIALIVLLTLVQLYVRFSARAMNGKALPELPGIIDESLRSGDKLVIYFSSEFCHPCKEMKPMIDTVSAETGNLIKLDALEHDELATQLQARGAPAFVFVERGIISGVHLGVLSETRLRARLT